MFTAKRVMWRTFQLTCKSNWTLCPPMRANVGTIRLHEVGCPCCGNRRPINDKGVTNTHAWKYWKCSGCKSKTSAQHWTCPCGIRWHMCQFHVFQSVSASSVYTAQKPRIINKRGHDGPAPGPEPKRPRGEESSFVACSTGVRKWRPPPGSILGLRFPQTQL